VFDTFTIGVGDLVHEFLLPAMGSFALQLLRQTCKRASNMLPVPPRVKVKARYPSYANEGRYQLRTRYADELTLYEIFRQGHDWDILDHLNYYAASPIRSSTFKVSKPSLSVVVRQCNAEGFYLLMQHLNVSSLCLANQGLRDHHVSFLAEVFDERFSNLTLNLEGNEISDEGCQHIERLLQSSVLLELNIGRNRFSDLGASLVAKGLYQNRSLKVMKMNGLCLTDECVGPLSHALRNHPVLQELVMSDTQVGSGGLLMLAKACQRRFDDECFLDSIDC
jgi:hypothetical protein